MDGVSYESIVEESNDGILVAQNGEIVYANERLQELTGYAKATLVGAPKTMLVTDDDAVLVEEYHSARTSDQEAPDQYEIALKTKSGDQIPIEFSVNQISYDSQPAVVAFCREVTEQKERKKYQRELKQSKQIIENSTDIATIIDPQGIVTYVSPAVEDMLGYEPEELIGTDGFGYQPEETKTDVATAIKHVSDNPAETETVQTRFRRADGSWCWIESTLRNRLNDDVIDGILVSSRDISERKEREQILEQLVQRIDDLINAENKTDIAQMATEIASKVFDAPLAGVHLLSEDKKRLEGVAANDCAREQFGVPPTYSRNDDDIASELICETFDRDRPFYLKDTEKYGTLSAESPARSALIHPLDDHGVFIVSETEMDAFDVNTQNLIELVSQTVTSGLNRVEREADLRESRQRIQRQNEQLDRFAGIVSHDLRNPLNAAQLRLDLLRREKVDKHIDDVEQSLNRMQSMIEDLLTLSRAGTVADNPQHPPLATVVTESWETAQTDDADFEVLVDESTAIEADRDRLRHVFENLFRNAVDHNDSPLTVRVGLLDPSEETTDDSSRGGFFIEDDGEGIPEDEYDNIFSHGYTTSDKGTGFGLSIVKDVVGAHGWTISITESDEGGARFEITGVKVSDRPTDSWY